MRDIEFLDDDGPPDTAPADRPETAAPVDAVVPPAWSRIGSGLLLVGAAGLFVTAPFCTVLGLRFSSTSDSSPEDVQRESVDGWGRIHYDVSSGITGQHATRFGTALCVLAAALLLLAGVALAPHLLGRRRPRVLRWSPGVLLLVLGTGVGVFGSAALELQNQLDNADSAGRAGDFRLHVTVGTFFWLGAAGIALVVLAVALPHLSRRRSPVRQAGDPPPTGPQADLTHG